ncbi:MAG: hypothetical protein KAU62_00125, partial [Candidatus Heimdallarchaeota archaeon]|nr:hypothetical protein [Candidatus Heimdallarchaeota archaeon]MCK4609536.1 hypothetical protein [Candidatus Heimdallarchaeota archaeon]
MAFIDKYHKFLKKYKVAILVIWVIIFAFGIWLGPKFLNETSSNFEAPANSPSVIAEEVLAAEFPGYENETSMIMVIRMVNDSESVVNDETESFCSQVIDSILNSSFDHIVLSVLSYYILADAGFSQVADGFISSEERSMLLTIDL